MKFQSSVLLGAVLGVAPALCIAQQSPTPTTESSGRVRSLGPQGESATNASVAAAIAENRARLDSVRQMVEEESQAVAKLKQSIRERTGLLSSAGLRPLVASLQLQRETLEEEDAAAAGRRAGLEKTIAEWTERAKASAKNDPLLDELSLSVTLREQELERKNKLRAVAAVSQGEIDDAKLQLAIERTKLAAARQRAANPTNDATDAWNRDLMNLNIAAQERAARLKYIASRLSALEPVLDDADHLESATADLHAAQKDLRSAKQRADEDERIFH